MSSKQQTDLRACAQICLDCVRVCSETFRGCLAKGGKHAGNSHITDLLDCMIMCEVTAGFLMRRSPLHIKMCVLCAEICTKCAKGCEGWKDAEMDVCAEECHGCAESCRSMLASE